MDRRSRLAPVPALLALTLATALGVAACGSAATPTPSPTPAPSPSPAASPSPSPSAAASPSPDASTITGATGTVTIPGGGLTITLADGWQAYELDAVGLEAIGDLFPPDSQIGQLLGGQAGSLAAAGVKLWAIDPRSGSIVDEFAPTLNVIEQPMPAGLSIELLGQLAKAQLEGLDAASDVVVDSVELPAGPAVKATYRLDQPLADGSAISAVGTQYYLANDESLFIVTFTAAAEAADELAPVFDAMAESIVIDSSVGG
jgi:hypothetical protein